MSVPSSPQPCCKNSSLTSRCVLGETRDFEHHLGAGEMLHTAVLGKVLLPLQTRLVSASGHKETLIWSPEEAHKVCSPREGPDTCSLESAEQHRVSPGVTQGLWGSLTGTEAGITALPSLQAASEAVRNGECLACRAASDIGRMTRSPRVLPEPTSHPGAPDISACRPHHLPATCSPCSLWKQPHRCHSN